MMRSWIGRGWLRLLGWTLERPAEMPRKFVFIAAPHTSNWDFPFMVATAWALGVDISWLGKHTLFQPPMGWFFRAMGGIPVDRRARHNLVQQVVEKFAATDALILGIPPEGTRGKVEYWKSGFYHIARQAEVPVGFAFLDFESKRAGIGGFVTPTGDVRADMDQIRAFYAPIRGKHPHFQSEPRLREEDEPAVAMAAE